MKTLLVIFLTLFIHNSYAQSIADEFEESDIETVSSDLPVEKIVKIAQSNRIFIISNDNESFDKGDFISLIIGSKLVTRALVAKNINGLAGIKILRVDSLALFKTLKLGDEVRVLRGDDSFFKIKKKVQEESKIQDEDDLYSDDVIDEDIGDLDEDKNRAIKTDNILSASVGSISSIDKDNNTTRYTQINGSWAYQIEDNVWVEALYGEHVIKDFPSDGLGTKVANFTFRAKYTFAGPLHTYLQPYAGMQMITAESPGAGVADEDNNDEQKLAAEVAQLESLEDRKLIFGVTLLKRLVPGWFLRGDFGNDLINVGFSLEF